MLLSLHTLSQVLQMFSSLLTASGTHKHTHFSCFPQNIPNMVNRFNSLQVSTFFSFSPVVYYFLIHCYILTYFYELIPDITLKFRSSFSILPFKVHQYLLHSLRIQPMLCISPYPPAVFSFSSLLMFSHKNQDKIEENGNSESSKQFLTEYNEDMALFRKSSSFFGGFTVFPNPT